MKWARHAYALAVLGTDEAEAMARNTWKCNIVVQLQQRLRENLT